MSCNSDILGLKRGFVKLHPHRKSWEENAEQTISTIKSVLGDVCIDAQHIGSTAIKEIHAKPVIDIAVAVENLDDIKPYFEALREKGINYRKVEETGQLLFTMGIPDEELKTHHIHVVRNDSTNWNNYLNFRDYLNACPEKAKEYEALKIELANQYQENRKAYTAGKSELIARLLNEAREWREKGEII